MAGVVSTFTWWSWTAFTNKAEAAATEAVKASAEADLKTRTDFNIQIIAVEKKVDEVKGDVRVVQQRVEDLHSFLGSPTRYVPPVPSTMAARVP